MSALGLDLPVSTTFYGVFKPAGGMASGSESWLDGVLWSLRTVHAASKVVIGMAVIRPMRRPLRA